MQQKQAAFYKSVRIKHFLASYGNPAMKTGFCKVILRCTIGDLTPFNLDESADKLAITSLSML